MILSTAALSEVCLPLAVTNLSTSSARALLFNRAHTMNSNRFRGVKPSDLPERVELIDNTTSQQIAVITNLGRTWQWQRKTTLLLHGAPPADGLATSLTKAKIKILEGLRNEG